MIKLTSVMRKGLLLSDIIETAFLDRPTVRYVLASSRGMDLPEAEGQGAYRRFDMWQAADLANAARLVMFGMPLRIAQTVPAYVAKRARNNAVKGVRPIYPFWASPSNPLVLDVLNGRYVQVWHQIRRHRDYSPTDDPELFLDPRTGMIIPIETDNAMPLWRWNLTQLGESLFKRMKNINS